jgi:hypothetical protein
MFCKDIRSQASANSTSLRRMSRIRVTCASQFGGHTLSIHELNEEAFTGLFLLRRGGCDLNLITIRAAHYSRSPGSGHLSFRPRLPCPAIVSRTFQSFGQAVSGRRAPKSRGDRRDRNSPRNQVCRAQIVMLTACGCVQQLGDQGVALVAALSMACPVAEMSCPAPAVVWQALRNGTAATSESTVRPMMICLYTSASFQRAPRSMLSDGLHGSG